MGWHSPTMVAFTGKFLSIYFTLQLIGRDGGLSTLCHSYGFACQQRVLKTFPDPDYNHSEDGVA